MLQKDTQDLFIWKSFILFLPMWDILNAILLWKCCPLLLAEMWMVCCITIFFLLSSRNSSQLTGRAWIILLNTLLTRAWRSFPTSSESSSPWAPGRSCRRNSRSVFLRNAQSRRWAPGANHWERTNERINTEEHELDLPWRRPTFVYCYELNVLVHTV